MADAKAQKDQNPSSDEPRKEASGVHVSLSENAENSHSRLNCPITDEIDRIGEERQKIGDSLSLYVEFVGSGSELRHQNAEEVELAEIKEENVGNCLFSVGDVVWVKTRNQNWCVGEIYDPSTASSYGVKPNPKKPGFFLVGHLVSGNVAWYSLPQLKPFYSNFAELSETSESRSFLCAVEKGVEQFGKNVISKLMRGRKDDDFGEIASVIINPKNLIAYVKSLAVSVAASIPIATLDLSIVGNYLSLLYRSMGSGEDELMKSPLKKGNSNLKPKHKKKRNRYFGNGSGNSDVEGSESRSRKKSKYLSYPYINLEKKESLTEKSPVLAKNSVSIPEMVSVPSTEILSELRDAAVEPACIKESRNFDKIEVLLYKFRSFLYRDDEDDSKNVVDEEKVAGGADPSLKIEPKKRRKREKKKKKKELELKPGIVPVVLKIDNNVDLKPPSGVEFAVQIEEQIDRPIKVPAMAASKKRKRGSKEEIAETEQSSVLPEGSVQKRKRPTIGSPLRLIFDKTNPLPAKDTIETELGKFGALKRIESPISEDKQSTVCVIFERKADAKQASQKLTKTNPFGPILLKHELEESGTSMALKNLAMRALKNGGIKAEALKTEQPHRPDVARRKLSAVTLPLMAASPPGEGPPLDLIKRNLEMMTSMLQKSGDNLSPETKAKLELEIQGLLGKVSSMV